MTIMYNDPIGGSASDIGSQIRTDTYQRKALTEVRKSQFFGQLADVEAMPKNMGKTIKRYHYLPLLDDANINDQGIDAAGATTTRQVTIEITVGDTATGVSGDFFGAKHYAVGEGANAAAALTAAETRAWRIMLELTGLDGTNALYDTFAEVKAVVIGYTPAWTVFTNTDVAYGGNLYGSSKDVGKIAARLPALGEAGGEVNRVSNKRVELSATISKFGIYDKYTQEALDFDTDPELQMHIARETLNAANEMTEDALQIDLLAGAGVIRYAGIASQRSEITGEGTVSVADYEDLMRLSIDLDNNRTPKNTKIITGTRNIDTATVDAARYLYIGSELIPTIKRMKDLHNNPAFVQVQHYAGSGMIAMGEIGAIDQFRIIVVPEMMHFAGKGAAVVNNGGYRSDGVKYNVYPMLVVGSGSFTTIGFQTDGKMMKFKIKHSKPGSPESYANDPYGETGFYSIKWYYGTMILRPERIGLVECVAEL